MPVAERMSQVCFNWVHGHHLVYNQCWEDPHLDHQALQLSERDTVMVITSAGCNALDYALAGPEVVHAVDINPLQNALLELKIAGIRQLDHESFFELFGRGRTERWDSLYWRQLRPALPPAYRRIWDRRGKLFQPGRKRNSFYFRGSSGMFAYLINGYINHIARMREAVNDLLDATSMEEQQEIFESRQMNDHLWKPVLRWCMRRDTTLAMLGVPRGQRQQLDTTYPGGIVQFIMDRIEAVFTSRPLHNNYFWRVYLTGAYTPECCPEYLKAHNFDRLKQGLIDRIRVHTNTVHGFLNDHPQKISRFVLLDHMDWLYRHHPEILAAEWQAIVDRAASNSRIIWRSAGLDVDFVDPIQVRTTGTQAHMGELLQYNRQLADELHAVDRVNTYGSFSIADLLAV